MVINLLSNAIKFTDSGSVTVSASRADGQLIVSVYIKAGQARWAKERTKTDK